MTSAWVQLPLFPMSIGQSGPEVNHRSFLLRNKWTMMHSQHNDCVYLFLFHDSDCLYTRLASETDNWNYIFQWGRDEVRSDADLSPVDWWLWQPHQEEGAVKQSNKLRAFLSTLKILLIPQVGRWDDDLIASRSVIHRFRFCSLSSSSSRCAVLQQVLLHLQWPMQLASDSISCAFTSPWSLGVWVSFPTFQGYSFSRKYWDHVR